MDEITQITTMKKSLFFSLVFSLNLIFAGIVSAAETTIAVIAPKAGENADIGHEFFQGARLAVEEINSNGGLLKQKIDLLTIDDRCDDRLAISTAEMLTLLNSKKVVLVVGPYCANRYIETTKIYQDAKIFQIIPTTEAFHSNDTEKKDQITLLSTKTQMSTDFFEFYNNNFAGLNVSFVYDDNPQTGYEETAQELHKAFKHYGKANLLKLYPYNHKQDKTDLAKTLKHENINVILVVGQAKHVTQIIYAAKKKNKNLIVFSNKKNFSKDLIDDLGKRANGLYAMELTDIKDSLLFTETLVNLRLNGSDPEGLEAYCYAAIKMWSELVKQTHTFDYTILTKKVSKPPLQEKWQEFLMHSGKINSAKYTIEMYKEGDFKQVY